MATQSSTKSSHSLPSDETLDSIKGLKHKIKIFSDDAEAASCIHLIKDKEKRGELQRMQLFHDEHLQRMESWPNFCQNAAF